MGKFLDFHGAYVYYRIEGSGPDVVLIHGFGEDGDIWQHQIAFLSAHCRLIIPHLPGSGTSVLPENSTSANEIGYFTAIIASILQAEKITTCVVLGHSMGGYIALDFAKKHSDLLTGFGLLHSTAFADSAEKKQNRQKGIELIESYGSYPFLKNTIPNLFADSYKKQHADSVTELIEKGNNFSKKALQHYYTAMMNRPDNTEILQNNELPVLFVIGTNDVAAPMQDVLQQVHLPKLAYVTILENCGHMGMWESTETFNKALLAFITGIN